VGFTPLTIAHNAARRDHLLSRCERVTRCALSINHRAQRSAPRSSSFPCERVTRCALSSSKRAQRNAPATSFECSEAAIASCALRVSIETPKSSA
jgi:hypothetical protein